jgi:hypothetical protein
MKYTITATIALLIGLAVGFGVMAGNGEEPTKQSNQRKTTAVTDISEQNPYEQIPVIDAYHEGEKVWFIHTDVSQEKMRNRLTQMVGYNTLLSKKLGGVAAENTNPIYVFTNGIDKSDAEPWGGGPFHKQIDIMATVPGEEGYSPILQPHLVTWSEDADPRVLTSVEKLKKAEKNGELSIKPTPVRVNAPVVKWGDTSDYLNGAARLTDESNN